MLGWVDDSAPVDGLGNAELRITRQGIRNQLYLYNGWMQGVLGDVLANSDHGGWPWILQEKVRAFQIPVDQVIPILLGQSAERSLTARELAEARERMTRWIGLLA